MSKYHLHAWLFSNPCGQVLKRIKSRGQIRPILLRRKQIFPHGLEKNHACKWILDNFPGLIGMSEFLENCQKSICMLGCSPIHVERSLSLLEFHGVRIWDYNLSIMKNHAYGKHSALLYECGSGVTILNHESKSIL